MRKLGMSSSNDEPDRIARRAAYAAGIETKTGLNKIYGGKGVDHLFGGGFASEIYGGEGVDLVQGGGFETALYRGEGTDMFGLASNAFVMDAAAEDALSF